jgi:hypothetical protein
MNRSLAVIETPISAYILALVCDNNLPIDIIYNFYRGNNNVDDVILVCSDILNEKNVQRNIIVTDGENWALDNRRNACLFVKERLVKECINLEKYDHIYANPFTNSFGFYLSTLKPIKILSHGAVDYLRYKYLFFEKLKLFLRTRMIMKKPYKYFGLIGIKNPKKGYVNAPQSSTKWNNLKLTLNIDNEIQQDMTALCAWTGHHGYAESYSQKIINLNIQLISEFCKLKNQKISILFFKFHRREIDPSIDQRNVIRSAFRDFADKVVFIDEIIENKYANYLPAELIVQKFGIKNVISSSSSVSWNCASMKSIDSYSFLSLGGEVVGLPKFLARYYNKLNKLSTKSPYDLSLVN